MRFTELPIEGAYAIEPEPVEDRRGHFARTFCRREFSRRGLNPNIAQCNRSFNRVKGTLRGMHYQASPHEESKLVSCLSGSTHHVIVDLRIQSGTYLAWSPLKLEPLSGTMLYIPEGVAHGFLTLEDNCEVFYQMSEFYEPASAAGVRWDDPAFGIDWPGDVVEISERDSHFPDYQSPD